MQKKLKGLLVVDKFFEITPEGPILVGAKCTECGAVYFPRKKVCTKCFRNDTMKVHPLAKKGEIVTYCVSHLSHIDIPTPYASGYVYLPDDDITIFSIITGWQPSEEKLFIGQQVELDYEIIRKDPWGNPVIAYIYRVVGNKSQLDKKTA
jgi:hypothetical protein